MTIKDRANLVALACLIGGCADDHDPQVTSPASSTPTTDGPTGNTTTSEVSTGDDPTGQLPSMEVCEQYLDCLAKVSPGGLPEAQQGFGPDGTCWQGSPETAEQCLDACQAGLAQWHEAFPDEPNCGAVNSMDGVDGQYLLAVSTTIDPDFPFQFVATFETDVSSMLTLTLQPLTLGMGNVTTPRQPFGAPLQFTNIPITNGQFSINLGTVTLAGPTNPITGSDSIAQLTLAAMIVDMDFVCGTVDGKVSSPLMVDLSGSTFAAVRIDAPNLLPSNVILNCDGTAVMGP